ncbi:RHS domain-containing protein [Burkholderia lata]|uniref:RHS domain-containing protein n=1 Tax=Burkholderia lata (strain ATCC 17760 / DSM 23089 / LMG 22485 / NCIMB 9086 / R18194 / 383) TaxID=482957 RepID=UPI0020C6ED32|nr:RHS domain-containing protein [Burkholderia lata]
MDHRGTPPELYDEQREVVWAADLSVMPTRNGFHANCQMTKLIKHPLFLPTVAFAVLCLIFSLRPPPETYGGKLRRCSDMCQESNRFGRLFEPKRASPRHTTTDYQCQCY